MDVGGKLLVALVAANDTVRFTDFRLTEGLFIAEEAELFKFCAEHVANYHTLPKLETIKKKFPDLPSAPEPSRYYFDKCKERFAYRRLNKALSDSNDLMKAQDTWTTTNLLNEAIMEIRGVHMRQSVIEFGADAVKMVADEYLRTKKLGLNMGVQIGWPTLDHMTFGLRPGDVLSIVGRPAMGKTFLTLRTGIHAWKAQKKKVMGVSMEMNTMAISQRVAAMYSGFSLTDLKSGEFTDKQWPKFVQKLKQAKDEPGKFWLIDGNLNATVDDVFNLAYQLEPDVILIDGAYLLKNNNPRMNKFQRVEDNLETIKQKCSTMGIPAVLSYQFNREATKTEKKSKGTEKGGLEHIAFSDSVGQISSVVLGLFEADNIETMVRREVTVLKGRNGETGKFYINWDFQGMDFAELSENHLPQNNELGYI